MRGVGCVLQQRHTRTHTHTRRHTHSLLLIINIVKTWRNTRGSDVWFDGEGREEGEKIIKKGFV